MNIIQICGIALITAVLTLILGQIGQNVKPFVLLAAILLLTAVLLSRLTIARTVGDWLSESGYGEYLPVLMKGLGICLLVEFCAALCRQSGAGEAATLLLWIGKAEILLLGIPLIQKLVDMIGESVG